MRYLQNRKGLTLVEVLVSTVILAIVIVPIMNSFAQSFKANHKNELQLELHAEAITIFEKVKTAVVEGRPLKMDDYPIDISAQPCDGYTTGEQPVTIKLSESNYDFSLIVNVQNYSKSSELEELITSIDEAKPQNLFKIDLSLTPINNSLQPESLSVIKFSSNGCGNS